MEIISHRGLWSDPTLKNSYQSFRNSFINNFGLETDIRDLNKNIVISHDLPDYKSITLVDMLLLYKQYEEPFLLALNVKSDGLQDELEILIKEFKLSNYFFFDMSLPDTIGYFKRNLNYFLRQSEYESDLPFYEKAKGIWLDAFEGIWYSEELVENHLDKGKKIAIVSSELHGREHLNHWKFLKSWNIINNQNIILCTDFPEKAKIFFKNE